MKAILVIDKPNKCSECGFYYDNKDNKISCYIEDYIKDCKGTCPLKPMPNKIDQGYPCEKYDEGYSDVWDDCIKEILSE